MRVIFLIPIRPSSCSNSLINWQLPEERYSRAYRQKMISV
jgi:hypothetical protein